MLRFFPTRGRILIKFICSVLCVNLLLVLSTTSFADQELKAYKDVITTIDGQTVTGVIQTQVPIFDESNLALVTHVEIVVSQKKASSRLRYKIDRIKSVTYRGDQILDYIRTQFELGNSELAFKSLQELESIKAKWRPKAKLRLEIGMQWGQLLSDAGKVDRAAFVYRITKDFFPNDKKLKLLLVEALSSVARVAYENNDYIGFQRRLSELEALNGQSSLVSQLRKQLEIDYTKITDSAKKALQKDNKRLALELYEQAYRMRPQASSIATILEGLRKSFQRFSYGEPTRVLGFDPVVNSEAADRRLQRFLFSGLVRHIRDPRALVETSYLVDLARSIKASPDGRVIYLAIRQPIFWSNGEKLTAYDVIATIQAMCAADSVARDASFARSIDLAKTRVRDSQKLKIALRFSSPRPRMLLDFPILPASELGNPPRIRARSQIDQKPVGTGPFVLDERRGNSIILTPNTYFTPPGEKQPKAPVLGEVRLTSFSDPTTARARLENDQIDLLTELHPADVVRLQANGRFRIRHLPQRKVTFLAFNHRRKYFQGRSGFFFRKAINVAVNKQKLLTEHYQSNTGFSGAHKTLTGPYPRESWAYNPTIKAYRYDLDLARQTLRQTGVKDVTLRLIHPPDPIITTICAVMKKQIQDAGVASGVKVRLVKLTPALFKRAIESRSFDLAYCSYSFDRPVLDLEAILADSETGKGGRNYLGYRHPDLAKLFDLLRLTDLWTKIRAVNQAIHKHLHENAVILPLWQLDTYFAHSRKLDNFEIHPVHLFGTPWKLTVR